MSVSREKLVSWHSKDHCDPLLPQVHRWEVIWKASADEILAAIGTRGKKWFQVERLKIWEHLEMNKIDLKRPMSRPQIQQNLFEEGRELSLNGIFRPLTNSFRKCKVLKREWKSSEIPVYESAFEWLDKDLPLNLHVLLQVIIKQRLKTSHLSSRLRSALLSFETSMVSRLYFLFLHRYFLNNGNMRISSNNKR